MGVRTEGYQRLGQELVRRGLLNPNDLVEAIRVQKQEGKPLPEVLLSSGLLRAEVLLSTLGNLLNVPAVDLRQHRIERAALKHIPEALARRYVAIPVGFQGNALLVALADPEDLQALGDLQARSGLRVQPAVADPLLIREAIDLHYKALDEIARQFQETPVEVRPAPSLDAPSGDAPAVRTLDLLLAQGVRDRASDIHIEPQPDRLKVRFRVDGVLLEAVSLPMAAHSALISRIKVLAQMNIAEKRLPQDGQFTFKASDDRSVDIRVATIETAYGERGVLRLLDKSSGLLNLDHLGFPPDALARYQSLLRVPHGIVLVAGPTGSGKTTTLYASIRSLDARTRNVVTVEDPVEYRFPDINQIQVNTKAGLTFASGLRALMRHDPDVILVGEIRDSDTAETAVQAALTGHLVLSSIHANDAESVVYRLINLGVDPFLIASSLVGVVAQRMVRRVCPHCSEPREASVEEQRLIQDELQVQETTFAHGRGCQSCAHTGYRGRVGVFEVLTMTEGLQRLVLSRAEPGSLRQRAIQGGMVPMVQDGLLKAREGVTTPGEVLRTLYSVR